MALLPTTTGAIYSYIALTAVLAVIMH